MAKEPVSRLDRSLDIDFICRDSERQQCIHQQSATRSDCSHCTKAHQSKACRLKARVSKKSSATQRARNKAMATRSLKKKLDLRKAVLTSMGNAIKQLHRTQHKKKPSFHQMPVCVCCDNFIIGTE
jgi:hypothetical protein